MRHVNQTSAFLVGWVSFAAFAPSVGAQTDRSRAVMEQQGRAVEASPSAGLRGSSPLPPIRLAPTVADRAPYTEWKTHLGPAADALVTAQVTLRNHDTGETIVQKATGVIVRCDGFILLPARLFHVPPPPGKAQVAYRIVDFTLSALPAQGAGVPTTWTAAPPRFSNKQIPYVLVKARDMHFHAAALMHPRNATAARRVEVVFPKDTGKEGDDRLEVGRVKAHIVQKSENDPLTLAFEADAAQTVVPPGAVVVDTESKMVVGILAPPFDAEADAFTHPTNADFTRFERFHDLSNAIGLAPKPDNRIAEAKNADAKNKATGGAQDGQEGMVWIPGGPLAVRTTDYPEVMGANVVCVPGFWIDRAEVTVSKYRAFLKATNYRPLPQGWTEADVTGSTLAQNGDLPVHGVSSNDAAAYALWAGKRLVTPIEWEWASRGAGNANVTVVDLGPSTRVRRMDSSPNGGSGVPGILQGRGSRITLAQINGAAAASGAPWPALYEDVTTTLEMNLRWIALLSGYREAKYWGYWQNPDTRRSEKRTPVRVPAWALTSEFRQLVSFATPASTVINKKYVQSVENNDGFQEWHQAFDAVRDRSTTAEDSLRLIMDMFNPLAIEPAGARDYDRSVFDVRDLGTNVPEWLQANRAVRPDERVEKVLPPLFDPVQQPNWQNFFVSEVTRRLTQFNITLNGGDRFDFPTVKSKITFLYPEDTGEFADSPHTVTLGSRPPGLRSAEGGLASFIDKEAMGAKLYQYPTRLLPFAVIGDKENAPDFGTGFRCVR